MLSASTTQEKVIDSVISLLRTHDFDGLDLFLYPGLRGSPKHDWWALLLIEVRPVWQLQTPEMILLLACLALGIGGA